jgi:hypothetical protein
VDDSALRAARALSEDLVRPWCRAYAQRVLVDRPADAVYEFLRKPRTFLEKLWHRGLYDRDPKWTQFSDKLRSRDYIAERLGPDYLVPLLWSGTDPDAIPFDDLPVSMVIKTNHGSGFNIIVDDKKRVDRSAVRKQLASWLNENYCESRIVGMEWGYKHVPPRIMVEAFVGSDGEPPPDHKFYCYSGRAEFIQLLQGRFKVHRSAFFDRDFTQLPMQLTPQCSAIARCRRFKSSRPD